MMGVDEVDLGGASLSERLAKVAADPRYRELVARRPRFTWLLTGIMLVVYFGYMMLIAFDKEFLAKPIGDGVTPALRRQG